MESAAKNAAKAGAEQTRILQQQTDASIREEQKRTKLLEDQIAEQKRAKEREEESNRNQEKYKREAKTETAVDGPVAEQQQAFIEWVREELAA